MAQITLDFREVLACLAALQKRLGVAVDYAASQKGKIEFEVPDDWPPDWKPETKPPTYCNTCLRGPNGRPKPHHDRRDAELLLGILKKVKPHGKK